MNGQTLIWNESVASEIIWDDYPKLVKLRIIRDWLNRIETCKSKAQTWLGVLDD